ncbi:hypothetical protein B0H13DRAFT_1888153 [Mycena leptocephala]|nr:hypothetical protein B0H13DRAFT_1888153 [Mycena leptocephala]
MARNAESALSQYSSESEEYLPIFHPSEPGSFTVTSIENADTVETSVESNEAQNIMTNALNRTFGLTSEEPSGRKKTLQDMVRAHCADSPKAQSLNLAAGRSTSIEAHNDTSPQSWLEHPEGESPYDIFHANIYAQLANNPNDPDHTLKLAMLRAASAQTRLTVATERVINLMHRHIVFQAGMDWTEAGQPCNCEGCPAHAGYRTDQDLPPHGVDITGYDMRQFVEHLSAYQPSSAYPEERPHFVWPAALL